MSRVKTNPPGTEEVPIYKRTIVIHVDEADGDMEKVTQIVTTYSDGSAIRKIYAELDDACPGCSDSWREHIDELGGHVDDV